MTSQPIPIGLGDPEASLIVYINKRPPLDEFDELDDIRAIRKNEISQIATLTGNHWRKIFNCYAKLAFELNNPAWQIKDKGLAVWQQLRDEHLLTNNCDLLLSFSPPDLTNKSIIKIICGKTYFNDLSLALSVDWLDEHFAINREHQLLVSPYFDYRQLSNQRITQLADLIKSFK